MSNQNFERITQHILTALESNLSPWRREWRTLRERGMSTVPVNAVTGRAYRGINTAILWSRGDDDMRYLTYNQAKQLGGNVRKGEKGTQVVFWQRNKYKKENTDGKLEEHTGLLCRLYTVFNVAQCEGLNLKDAKPVPVVVPPTLAEVFERLKVAVKHGGDVASYSPLFDTITMPKLAAFTTEDAYMATGLHECSHATGHKSRLDRPLINRFGTDAYAVEELIAELSAAFLCASLGVNSGLENHASYLKHWIGVMKQDSRAIITASSRAQAAADYVLKAITGTVEAVEDAEADDVAMAA